MRNLIWIGVAVVILAGGYLLFSGKEPSTVVNEAADVLGVSVGTEAPETSEPVAPTEEAVGGESAEEATEVDEATDGIAEAVEGAAEDATEAVEEAVDQLKDTATEAVADATESASDLIDQLLSVEGFDLAKVTELIENADLGVLQTATLTEGLEAAQDNPELLEGLLARIREALGN